MLSPADGEAVTAVGTGRSTAVVAEVAALLARGRVAPGEIAVVTTGPGAAHALRRRVLEALDGDPGPGGARPGQVRTVVEGDLLDMTVGTVTDVATVVVAAHTDAAGLPPCVALLDPVADRDDRHRRLDRFLSVLLTDPAHHDLMVRALALDVDEAGLRDLADALYEGLDRLEGAGALPLDPVEEAAGRDLAWRHAVLGPLEEALARGGACGDRLDRLALHLEAVVEPARHRLAHDDEAGALRALLDLPDLACPYGQQEKWQGRADEVRAACAAAQTARVEALTGAGRAVAAGLGAALRGHVLATANARRAEGRLGALDVLVLARRLLHLPEVGDWLRDRFAVVVVDDLGEPTALERAVLGAVLGLVGAHRGRGGPVTATGPHPNRRSVPGIVAFVDAMAAGLGAVPAGTAPATPRAARPALGAGAPPARTRGPAAGSTPGTGSGAEQLVLEGVTPAGAAPAPAPPPRRARSTATPGRPAAVTAPAVTVLGGPVRGGVSETARAEVDEVARAVAAAVNRGWDVLDSDDGTVRPCRWGDVAVLLPDPGAWPALADALRYHEVPHRLEDGALLWRSEEVGDVLTLLRAADDPGDAVAVVAALRLAGSGCGDDDLVTWRGAGGSWDPLAPVPGDGAGHPVAEALALVAGLHARRAWAEPSQLVAEAVAGLHARALALAEPHPRDRWHRLGWLEDQARGFDDAGSGTLRAFLAWADAHVRAARATPLPSLEPDDDAVRVLTVAAGWGREFAVVVVAGGGGGEPRPDRDLPPALWRHDQVELRLNHVVASAHYADAAEARRRAEGEARARRWLTAVARGRDHVVVALHHRQPRPGRVLPPPLAARLHDLTAGHPGLWRRLDPDPDPARESGPTGAAGGRGGGGTPGPEVAAEAAAWEELVVAFEERRRRLVDGHETPEEGGAVPDPG
ncbi:MAG TPA: UvrD-helicase domain-containing protein [Acidimicrobiales bacterium]|nr:UvrD-helicase domain-containing protein [Acidimicrobiales bacterium]